MVLPNVCVWWFLGILNIFQIRSTSVSIPISCRCANEFNRIYHIKTNFQLKIESFHSQQLYKITITINLSSNELVMLNFTCKLCARIFHIIFVGHFKSVECWLFIWTGNSQLFSRADRAIIIFITQITTKYSELTFTVHTDMVI